MIVIVTVGRMNTTVPHLIIHDRFPMGLGRFPGQLKRLRGRAFTMDGARDGRFTHLGLHELLV